MYGLDLMLQELLIKKDFVVQMVRLSLAFKKDENILMIQRDNAFLYLAKKMFV